MAKYDRFIDALESAEDAVEDLVGDLPEDYHDHAFGAPEDRLGYLDPRRNGDYDIDD